MKACFGADNVNDDQDAAFQSCAASPLYGGDEAIFLQKLPGCNPVQYGPVLATQASGEGCDVAAATAVSIVPDAVSSIASSVLAPVSSILDVVNSVMAAAATSTSVTSAKSSSIRTRSRRSSALQSISLRKAQIENAEGYGGATLVRTLTALDSSSVALYTPTAISGGGSLGLVFDGLATATDDCKAVVTITVTPAITVTVSAGANASTTTVTDITTVTIPATYRHKSHGDLHR
jgi:hypothetical protein